MRNYTYIEGTRFSVANLFRSLRFDIDRLDMSWVGDQKPVFSIHTSTALRYLDKPSTAPTSEPPRLLARNRAKS